MNLIEELKQKFSVANIPLHGECLIIPNSNFKPDWADELESAGYKVFSGEYRGEVAWVIPLNRKKPPSWRPWTEEEDRQLLEMYEGGYGVMEVARTMAPKLGRTVGSVKARLQRLLKKHKKLGLEASKSGLRSLLESALLLASDPKHRDALKLILQTCLDMIE